MLYPQVSFMWWDMSLIVFSENAYNLGSFTKTDVLFRLICIAFAKAPHMEFMDRNLISDLWFFSLIERAGDDSGFCSPNLDTVAMSSNDLIAPEIIKQHRWFEGDQSQSVPLVEPEPRQRKPAVSRAGVRVGSISDSYACVLRKHTLDPEILRDIAMLLSQGYCITKCGRDTWWQKDILYPELQLVRSECLKLSHRPLLLWTFPWCLVLFLLLELMPVAWCRSSTDMDIRQVWILICISLTHYMCDLGQNFLIHKL